MREVFVHIHYEDRTYYLSNSAVTKEHVYYPYLFSVPSLGIGGEGFAKVTTGQVSLIRVDDDLYHPFSGDRYYSLISTPQEIPFEIYFDVEEKPIFVGNLTLSDVTEDELRFMVVEEKFEKPLIHKVLDRDTRHKIEYFYLYEDPDTDEYYILFGAPIFSMEDLSEVIIERTYAYESQKNVLDPFLALDYESDRDNTYLIAPGRAYKSGIQLVTTDDQSQFIQISDLLNYLREGKTYYQDENELLTAFGFSLYQVLGSDPKWKIADAPLQTDYIAYAKAADGSIGTFGPPLYYYHEILGLQQNEPSTGNLYLIPNQPENPYYVGTPVMNPFSFGEIHLRDPVIPFGDRKLKSDYTNYSKTDGSKQFEPTAALVSVNTESNIKIFNETASQTGRKYEPPTTRKVVKQGIQQGSTGTATSLGLYDPDNNTWATTANPGRRFNKVRINFNRNVSSGNSIYGSSSTSFPTYKNIEWNELTFTCSLQTSATWTLGSWVRGQAIAYSSSNRMTWTADTENVGAYVTEYPTYSKEVDSLTWEANTSNQATELYDNSNSWIIEPINKNLLSFYVRAKKAGSTKNLTYTGLSAALGDSSFAHWDGTIVAKGADVSTESSVQSYIYNYAWYWRFHHPVDPITGLMDPKAQVAVYCAGDLIHDFGTATYDATSSNVNWNSVPKSWRLKIKRISRFSTKNIHHPDIFQHINGVYGVSKFYNIEVEYVDYKYHYKIKYNTLVYSALGRWYGYFGGTKYNLSLGKLKTEKPLSTAAGLINGYSVYWTTQGSAYTETGKVHYAVKIRYWKITTQAKTTGTFKLYVGGTEYSSTWGPYSATQSIVAAWGTKNGNNIYYNKAHEITADGTDFNKYFAITIDYMSDPGWTVSNNSQSLGDLLSGGSWSSTASNAYLELSLNTTYYFASSFSWSASLKVKKNIEVDETVPAVTYIAYIPATDPYYLEDLREKIYIKAVEETQGFDNINTNKDYAVSTNWAKNLDFDQSSGSGYFVSQIVYDLNANAIFESEEKLDCVFTSSSTTVPNTINNIPQGLDFSAISLSQDMLDLLDPTIGRPGIRGDYFRLYRTDTLNQNPKDISIIRVRYGSDKPTISETSTTTFTENRDYTIFDAHMNETTKTVTITHYINKVVIGNFGLDWDNDPGYSYIDLDCFGGAIISNMIFYDDQDNVLSGSGFPDGSSITWTNTLKEKNLPKFTQKIEITIQNETERVDLYSAKIRGMDIFVFERIYPTKGNSGVGDKSYAVIGSFEYIDLQPLSKKIIKSYHFNDMFEGTIGSKATQLFDAATGELNVYSIRNPGLVVEVIEDDDGNDIDWTPRVFDDGVELGVDMIRNSDGSYSEVRNPNSQVYTSVSDLEFINLSVNPFGQIGISGRSSNGLTVYDFFNYIASRLTEENQYSQSGYGKIFLTSVDFSKSENPEQLKLPIYQDSDITIFEMAVQVAKAINYQFYFEYGFQDSDITRQIKVVDINYIFNSAPKEKIINQREIVNLTIQFPYPVMAFESTLSKNVRYFASSSQNYESIMKKIDAKYRIPGSGIGNVENYEVYAETFEEGKVWLARFKETDMQPKCTLEYNGIDREITIGSKVGFVDEFRKISGFLVVQNIQYNFQTESTQISGISAFEEIIYT